MNKASHTVQISVRWRDLDTFNHVNNAVYLTYMEQARVAWLQQIDGAWETPDSAPILRRMEVDFLRPIEHPAELQVSVSASAPGRSSLRNHYEIRNAEKPEIIYASAEGVLVWINPASGRPTPLPDDLRRCCQA